VTIRMMGLFAAVHESGSGTTVWTGRVLQARCERWRGLVLRFCIRPVNRAFVLLAIMDIRAHPFSFSERP
jgi:hypothetical protein